MIVPNETSDQNIINENVDNKVLPTSPYIGTRDFYPETMSIRNWFFSKMRSVVERFGYDEYNGPILESYDIYAAKSGEDVNNVYNYDSIKSLIDKWR